MLGLDLNDSGSMAPGAVTALEYLTETTRAMLEERKSCLDASGKNTVIIGNGDTATDCVATAVRQGAASVVQLVRKPRAASSAARWPYCRETVPMEYGQEEAAAVYGGDPRLYETTLQEIHTDETGQMKELTVLTAGKPHKIPADLLIIAAGFSGSEPGTAQAFGLKLNERGCLGDAAYRTENPKVFACGDMRRGSSLVVRAIAEGRACAREADLWLEGYTNMD